jgi:peptide/nickel transport system substrate-binding protein
MRWSDGAPMTADDVAFTYGVLYRPEYAGLSSLWRPDLVTYIDSVTAPDPLTVVIKTKQVYAGFLTSYGAVGIIPKHVLGTLTAKQLNTADFNRAPTVSNGPFKFVRWDAGQQIVYQRNDNYHRGVPLLDSVVYKIASTTDAAINGLLSGEIDIALTDVRSIIQLQSAQHLRVLTVEPRRGEQLYFNLDRKVFADKAVRQALLYGIDYQAAIKGIFFDQAKISDSFVLPSHWSFNPSVTPKYRLDRNKAQQLLDAAGWTRSSSGIRAKDGIPLSFKLIVGNNRAFEVAFATALQQDWLKIGVDGQPLIISNAGLASASQKYDFDAILGLTPRTTDPDPSQYVASWNHTASGGTNVTAYANPKVDALLKQAEATLDQASRKKLYGQLQDMLADDAPAPFLLWVHDIWGINKRVNGVDIGSYNTTPLYGTMPWLKDLWVTDGK